MSYVLLIGSGELAHGGLVLPLDDYLANWDGWAQYDEPARFGVTVQGKTWSVPWGLNVYYVFYRKDLFEAAGMATNWQPQTRDDLIDTAATIKASNPDVIPMSLYAGANGENATAADFLTLILSNGGTLTDANGKWFIDSCAIRNTLAFYEEAFQTSGVVPQSVLTDVESAADDAEGARRWRAGDLARAGQALWRVARGRSGKRRRRSGLRSSREIMAVRARRCRRRLVYQQPIEESADLAWAFIEAFNSADTQAALASEIRICPRGSMPGR